MRDSSPSKGETKGINVSEQTLIRFDKLIEKAERISVGAREITIKILGSEVKPALPSTDEKASEETFFERMNSRLFGLSRICDHLSEDVERLQQNF